jgi:WD40 repeat protein
MAGNIQVIVSQKNLEFTPDGNSGYVDGLNIKEDNELDVIVINESDKFASFQIELATPGLDDGNQIKWYRVQPEICAKKPPGSQTQFHLEITKVPIPAYDTTIDLILKVFSVEHEKLYTSQKLKLTIKKPLRSLRLDLPIKELKAKPQELIEIPVSVYNLSSKFSEITLTCSGLDPDWLLFDPDWSNQKTQRTFTVEPGDLQKTRFLCQPLPDTLSKEYTFTITAKSNTSQYTTREQGVLKVIPDGVVQFICENKEQTIPAKKSKTSHLANYALLFYNSSNIAQTVKVNNSEIKLENCEFQTIPEYVDLVAGEAKNIQLVAAKKRHLFGFTKRLLFEVSTVLTQPSSEEPSTEIFPDPKTQILTLKVLPVIPVLLQFIGGSLLLLTLLLYYLLPKTHHTGNVNSVRLFGNGNLVFSGSSDQTIRRWQVEDNPFILDIFRLKHKQPLIAEKDQTNKAVRVIRQSPKDNDRLAVGLENGEVKLWDISTNTEIKSLNSEQDKDNRVFDLVFTRNGRYLFSGHGNGIVNKWDLETINNSKPPQEKNNFQFSISALTINENSPNNSLIFLAGQYNRIVVWDWQNKKQYALRYQWQDWEKRGDKPVFGQQHYITSLATSGDILASSDNQGHVSLWNIQEIRRCIQFQGRQELEEIKKQSQNFQASRRRRNRNSITNSRTKQVKSNIIPISSLTSCNNAIIAQNPNVHGNQPVRSVALTEDGKYLASGGDDGKILLWNLQENKDQNLLKSVKTIAKSEAKINSVDIKALQDYLLITSGDDYYKVKLYRVNGGKKNDSSK